MAVRVLVLGNCQAQMLEALFSIAAPDCKIHKLPPTYQMREEMRGEVLAALNNADVIFAQRVAPDYHLQWLTPTFLKEHFRGRIWIWPNIYFDGYMPGVQYVYLKDWGKLQSPLEDYHFRELVEFFRLGVPAADAVVRLTSVDVVGEQDYFSASLEQLRSREADVDIPISDFLEGNVALKRCFYTPNHPYNFVLTEMATRLARQAAITFRPDVAASLRWRLDKIYIPAYPRVVARYGLKFDRLLIYRGLNVLGIRDKVVELGEPRSFHLRELVDQFYLVYEGVFGTRDAGRIGHNAPNG